MTPSETVKIGSETAPKTSFLRWYLVDRPREIVATYVQYAHAFGESFALKFMLKTLVAPWKSITDEYPDKGFNIGAIMETLVLNLTSRAIGLVIRFCTIVTGIVIQILLLVGFAAYLLLWIAYPLALLAGIPYLVLTF